ncbi:uncharacterized protein LOC125425754 isoform X1 [Sphaerodactylus townsendi]|uniref:uncharacterized protein LOC125425754 isoform X1 n=2 Tax=Sphaerodactylus townsendi TaxID=933632 RepID=UPI0020275A16|nr:uncharacterized protein LOC125425754 isoform X1 [Sphaerodactylus townsendi]
MKFADEIEAPKPSESVNEIISPWPWREVEFQEAVFSGDKFEPFLRHIRGVQPPVPPKEISMLSHLDKERPYVETKEQEDQDPPHPKSPTKSASSSDTKLVKGDKQLSILRLIEKNIEIEEKEPQFTKQIEEEPKPPAVEADLSQKLSESEVKQVHVSFKRSFEDFLVNRLTKVIALKSLLSKHVENLVEERLLEAEISEELEDSMDVECLSDIKGKNLLLGRKPCSRERLSEQDICNLKTVASQNLQASLIGKLSAHGIIPGMELSENNQKVPKEDLLKRKKHLSKEGMSRTEIITLKSLSESQSQESSKTGPMPSIQENQLVIRETDLLESKMDDREPALHQKTQRSSVGTNTEAGLEKECPPKSLEIIRVRLPTSTETELPKKSLDNIKLSGPEISPKSDPNKTVNDTLIEKLLKAEIASLKSFLSKGLQDHFKDKLSETGLSTKDNFEKVCQQLSLNVKDELTMALGRDLPEGSHISSEVDLPGIRSTQQKSMFSESIQNFVLETLSENEIATLKSVLNKKIQDHLLERLSEIGLITEEELRKVLENFFPVVTEESLPKGNNEKVSFKHEETAHSTSSLTQSLQDRFSEDELKNLKSLLNRLLKEDHRDKLSDSEIKGLTSVLQKNFKDLPTRINCETGMSKEVETKDESCNTSLLNIEESSPGGTSLQKIEESSSGGKTISVSEKEKSHSKDNLSKILPNIVSLGGKPGVPVSSVFETDELHKETQTNDFMSPPKKVALKVEKPDTSVNSVLGIETTQSETQTNFPLPPPKIKQGCRKECHGLPGCDKPDVPNSKRGYEAVLRNQPFNEPLARVSDVYSSSSFLSAHDIGVQAELKNYLSRPPSYLSKPTFPVNPQTFLYLHSESEEETKLTSRLHQRPKGKKKADRCPKKDIVPCHLQQGAMNMQVKKEKPTGGTVPKDVLKEKGRKHYEPPAPKLIPADNRKDIKTIASPGVMKKESLKLKSEKKRDDVKPKKVFSKPPAPTDPPLQNFGKNLPDKASASKFPASWRTTGNALVRTDCLTLGREKAVKYDPWRQHV